MTTWTTEMAAHARELLADWTGPVPWDLTDCGEVAALLEAALAEIAEWETSAEMLDRSVLVERDAACAERDHLKAEVERLQGIDRALDQVLDKEVQLRERLAESDKWSSDMAGANRVLTAERDHARDICEALKQGQALSRHANETVGARNSALESSLRGVHKHVTFAWQNGYLNDEIAGGILADIDAALTPPAGREGES